MVVVTTRGKVSMNDRHQTTEQIAFDEELPERANVLIDVRNEEEQPTELEIRWMTVLAREIRRRFAHRLAFVTKPGEKRYKIVAAFASQAVGGVMAFEHEDDAVTWLLS
jgi:hypothetical protein